MWFWGQNRGKIWELVIFTPKAHNGQGAAPFELYWVKIGLTVWAVGFPKNVKKGLVAGKCYMLGIPGKDSSEPTATLVGMWGHVPNVITHAQYHLNRLSGG